MIQVLTGEEIHFNYLSKTDQRLKGNITIKNILTNQYQAFKVKYFSCSSSQPIIPSSKPIPTKESSNQTRQ